MLQGAIMKGYKLPIDHLNDFNETQIYTLDEQLEFYESTLRINSEVLKKEKYASINKSIVTMLARSFSNICDDNIKSIFSSIDGSNTDLFWKAFDKFNLEKKINESVMNTLFSLDNFVLWQIIEFRQIVKSYDEIIADYMVNHPLDAAPLLIDEYLVENRLSNKKYFFPISLNKEQKYTIIDKFVESNPSNFDYLRIIAEAQSSVDLPLNAKTQIKAKHLYDESLERFFHDDSTTHGGYGVQISFENIDEDFVITNENNIEKIVYNDNWIRENLDYPTILNNFIYLFGFTNLHYICQFVAKEHLAGVFSLFGLKGKKEYKITPTSQVGMMKSKFQMHLYYRILNSLGVDFEDIIKWFFEEYLKEEFGAEGFSFSVPSKESNYLNKCKSLVTEMDGILRQYKIFCEEGVVDRELLEFSSEHIKLNALPSMAKKKYAYASDKFFQYTYILFKEESGITYIEKFKDRYDTLLNLIMSENVFKEDFRSWDQPRIQELIDNKVLIINKDGFIKPEPSRVTFLRVLYNDCVLCLNYYTGFDEVINDLYDNDLLFHEETLFTRTEQQFINYILNRSEFSNGLDLRNKYSHGSNSINDNQNYNDYIELLRIMVLIIIKINEEMLLREKEQGSITQEE